MHKILVVEDSAAMRGFIASVVEEIDGTEVVEVKGGFEALKEIPRETYSLIITDINMPDINGLELIAFVRKHPNHKNAPVLVVTSETEATHRDKALSVGANAYLAKPFNSDELRELVERLLNPA